MKIVKVMTITILLIGTMVGAIKWMEKIDSEREQAYAKYEACFALQYRTTPSAWYEANGELPECDINN